MTDPHDNPSRLVTELQLTDQPTSIDRPEDVQRVAQQLIYRKRRRDQWQWRLALSAVSCSLMILFAVGLRSSWGTSGPEGRYLAQVCPIARGKGPPKSRDADQVATAASEKLYAISAWEGDPLKDPLEPDWFRSRLLESASLTSKWLPAASPSIQDGQSRSTQRLRIEIAQLRKRKSDQQREALRELISRNASYSKPLTIAAFQF